MRPHRSLALALLTLVGGAAGCDSTTEPTEERVLGLVDTGGWGPTGESPRSWIVEGRTFMVEITTVGTCDVTRPDWDLILHDGQAGFVFILPFEYRSLLCPTSPDRGRRIALFTDTLEVDFNRALDTTVRVVSADGSVYDMYLDFHPGYPH